ncbi:MAG: hypothetical protein Gyms2KO_20370 [Gymnodinialimonas sp.]
MSCGVCNPKAFRTGTGGRVYGYQTINSETAGLCGGAAPDLHFLGAEYVLTDWRRGPVAGRPGYRLLCNGLILRQGDRLIVDSAKSFGGRNVWRKINMERIRAMGVDLNVLTPEGRGMRYA